ncbi:MAG: transcriptional regulator PpsR [Polaromonas sp.]|nr:transcriptional regulator PpsR [Polaromonas sp.]
MKSPLQATTENTIGHFESPELFLAGLDPQTTASLISAAADVALILDEYGVIRDMAFGSDELRQHGYRDWLGKPWLETVTIESRSKVEEMLSEASHSGSVKWRHINHPSTDSADLALLYTIVPLSREAGSHRAVAFGRDLRSQVALQQRLVSAQLSMERDYWRLRHVETRYRLLFQVAAEAVLILDATTEKLEEANPAAYKLLGDKARVANWTLIQSLDSLSVPAVLQMFAALRLRGRADPITVCFTDSSDVYNLSGSLFRQENSTHFLVRVTPLRPTESSSEGGLTQTLLRVIDNAPDAFVVTDMDGRVLTVNRAFLELTQLASEALVRGEPLQKWLGRSGVDMNVLISNLRQRGTVRLFATTLQGEYGSTAEVEISAVSVTTGDQPCLGFTIRDIGRRLTNEPALTSKDLPRSAGQMTELVGRVPLRDIVRETTDLIEELCIQAALELTGDNRAAAAEMLGLSRQSLYVKLKRFGVGDLELEN